MQRSPLHAGKMDRRGYGETQKASIASGNCGVAI